MVIGVKATYAYNSILLHHLTSPVDPGEPEIGNTDQSIPIKINCNDDELHYGIPGGSANFKEGDNIDKCNNIHDPRLPQQVSTDHS
jgi:hypothetical protein